MLAVGIDRPGGGHPTPSQMGRAPVKYPPRLKRIALRHVSVHDLRFGHMLEIERLSARHGNLHGQDSAGRKLRSAVQGDGQVRPGVAQDRVDRRLTGYVERSRESGRGPPCARRINNVPCTGFLKSDCLYSFCFKKELSMVSPKSV